MKPDQRQIDELTKQVTKGGGELPARRLQAVALHRIADLLEDLMVDERERRATAKRDDARWAAEEAERRKTEED